MRRYWVLPVILLSLAIVIATGTANSVSSHHHSARWTTDLSLSHAAGTLNMGSLHWLPGCHEALSRPTPSGIIVRTMLAAAGADVNAEEEGAEEGGKEDGEEEEEEGPGGWDRLWDAPKLG